ncbi:MAG: VOC family protein [Clostridiales bacterium]|nr:VOC family protein [Clostridiales bacterium]
MGTMVIPYLSFYGDCKQAIEIYTKAFGGQINYVSYWGEVNCNDSKQWGKVMHVEFTIGDTAMSGGDQLTPISINEAVKLMVHMSSKEEALKSIEILSDGGKLVSPLMPHPKPDDGGTGALVKDAFGYTWIITCPNPDKE